MPPEEVWELRYDPRVRKRLQRIRSKTLIRRIEEAARSLQSNPLSGKPVRNHPEVRSKRVTTSGGEYRIIYLPIKEDRAVLVILVATRQEVYKLLGRKSV